MYLRNLAVAQVLGQPIRVSMVLVTFYQNKLNW